MMCVSLTLFIDPVLTPTQPIQSVSRFANIKHRLNLRRRQGPVNISILHAHFHKAHTHTHTLRHVYHPRRPLCCRADGAGVVSFNDGEASPGEASLSNILSGVCADSAHQHDTDVGQRRGNAAHSSHSGEQKKY